MERIGGNEKGSRNKQSKNRNATRKAFRAQYPLARGKKLNRWPLEDYYRDCMVTN